MAALIDGYGTTHHYPLAMFQNSISKRIISSITGNIDDVIPPSDSDSAMTSMKNKHFHATFKILMKIHCLSLKAKDDVRFKIKSKILAFLLKILKAMLNHVIDRISLQQLEYEM